MFRLETFKNNVRDLNADTRLVASQDDRLTSGDADAGLIGRHKVKEGDYTQAQSNNFVRQQLLNSALDQCGVKKFADLPECVRKAFKVGTFKDDMKLDANGQVTSGRPLTARRVRQIVVAVEQVSLKNPTGDVCRVIEGDGLAKAAIEGMKSDALDASKEPFEQMAKDYQRDWNFIIGNSKFEHSGDFEGKDLRHDAVLNPSSDFRKAFRAVFTEKDDKVNEKAEKMLSRVLHQGLMSFYQTSPVPPKFGFDPMIKPGDGSKHKTTVTLDKAENPGRYVVSIKREISNFDRMANYSIRDAANQFGEAPNMVKLKGDRGKNKQTISFKFEFGLDEQEQPDFKMLENPTQELEIPERQELDYMDWEHFGMTAS